MQHTTDPDARTKRLKDGFNQLSFEAQSKRDLLNMTTLVGTEGWLIIGLEEKRAKERLRMVGQHEVGKRCCKNSDSYPQPDKLIEGPQF
jgi:hypothetical protein